MNRIAALRKERGLTQAELAKAIGVNTITISRYENETRNPKMDKLEKMSKIFGANYSYIMGHSTTRTFGFHLPDDTDKNSFELFKGTPEYFALYTECKNHALHYLKKNYSVLSSDSIQEITNEIIEHDIYVFWSQSLKNPNLVYDPENNSTSEGINKVVSAIDRSIAKHDALDDKDEKDRDRFT